MVKLPGEPGQSGWETDVSTAPERAPSEPAQASPELKPTVVDTFTRPEPAPVTTPDVVEEAAPEPPTADDLRKRLRELGGTATAIQPPAEADTPLLKNFTKTFQDIAATAGIDRQATITEARARSAESKAPKTGTPIDLPEKMPDDQAQIAALMRTQSEAASFADAFKDKFGRTHPWLESTKKIMEQRPGFMTPEAQKEWAETELKDAKRWLDHYRSEAARADLAITQWQEAHPGQKVPRWMVDQAKTRKPSEKTIADAEARVKRAEEIIAGKRAGAVLNPAADATARVGRGFVGDTVGLLVQGIGAGAGYAGRNIAGMDVTATDNKIASFGRWIEAKSKELFPADPARQEEFRAKLAQGAGSMIGFYGPAVIGKMMGLSNKMLIGVTAATGSQISGAGTIKDAIESARKGREVNEWDLFFAYMGGSVLGLSEAAPIATLLGPGGRGQVRAILAQMAEEGAQESFQTFGENLIARLIHDPKRQLGQGVAEAGIIGAILGGGMKVGQLAISPEARAEARGELPVQGDTASTPEPVTAPRGREDDPIAAPPRPAAPGAATVADPAEIPPAPKPPKPARTAVDITDQPIEARPIPTSAEVDTEVVTPDGSMSLPVETVLVELDDLAYASGDLQPRDRSRKESESLAIERANQLDPYRLLPERVSDSGAPVIAPDGTIISGNGRVMSIRHVYESQNLESRALAYRDAIGPEARGMSRPVLVRRITGAPSAAELQKFADLSNRSAIATMSATERATRDASSMARAGDGAGLMRLYQGGSFEAPENRDFLRAFVDPRNGIVTPNERSAMAKDGRLTKEGMDRLQSAVLASAYDDPQTLQRMLESTSDAVKAISGAMGDVAGLVTQMRQMVADGQLAPEFDISPFIMQAANEIAQARAQGTKIADLLAQTDAFAPRDPIVEALIRGFYNENLSRPIARQKMAFLLREYINQAVELTGTITDADGNVEGALFANETTPQDVLDRAVEQTRTEIQLAASDLFTAGAGAVGGRDAGVVAGNEGSGLAGGVTPAGTQDANINTDDLAAKFIRRPDQGGASAVPPDQFNFFAEIFGPQGGQGPELATEPTDDMRRAFAEVLATDLPRRRWGDAVAERIQGDITEPQLDAMEAESVQVQGSGPLLAGRLRRSGSRYLRTELAKERLVGGPSDLARREARARERMAAADYATAAAIDNPPLDTSKLHSDVPFFSTEWRARRRYTIPGPDGTPMDVDFDTMYQHAFEAALAEAGGGAQERRGFVIIGHAGAGKSTLADPLMKESKAVLLTPDEIRPFIPEYDGGKNSAGVHEEASEISKALAGSFMERGYNVVFEKIGGSVASIEKPLNLLAAAGYSPSLIFVDVPVPVAMERAIGRFESTGRAVPVKNYDLNIANTYTTLKVKEGLEHGRFEWQEPQGWRWAEAQLPQLGGFEIGDKVNGTRIVLPPDGSTGGQPSVGRPDRNQGLPAGIPPGSQEGGSRVDGRQVGALSFDLGIDEGVAVRQEILSAKGQTVPADVIDAAHEIEAVFSDPAAVQAIVDRFGKNNLKPAALELARLVGKPPKARTTKKDALASIVERAREEGDNAITDLGGAEGSVFEGGATGDVRGPQEVRGTDDLSGGIPAGSGRDGGAAPVRVDPGQSQPGSGQDAGTADVRGSGGELLVDPAADRRNREIDARVRDAVAEADAKRKARRAENYQITDEDGIGDGGPKTKVRGNIEAIRTLRQIEQENRTATREEQRKLAKFVGWGAFAQALFDTKADTKNAETWAKERAELKDILTKEEYDSAAESTLNAHYTSQEVVEAMWGAMQHLGFDGGRVIEPAAGSGNFIGLTPADLRSQTDWVAVELDKITGGIAKNLYRGSDVRIGGYENQRFPDNFFDAAISNVPFGDFSVPDRGSKAYKGLFIHDYYFVKSLDKVRPGGIVAFITSSGTMDKADTRARRLIAERGDLIGAIRLPGGNKGAFASNAGTEVTTDILFVQKRAPGQTASDTAWLESVDFETQDGPTKINEYFVANPQMMLGDMRLIGSMRRADMPVLIGPTDNLGQRISEAVTENLPERIITPRGEAVADQLVEPDTDTDGIKEGAFYEKDGRIYRKIVGIGEPIKTTAANGKKIRDFLAVRDAYNAVLSRQARGESADIESLRGTLNRTYDAFVKRHGPISRVKTTVQKRTNSRGEPIVIKQYPNFAPFRDDPDAYKVLALEIYDENTDTAEKANVFSEDVLMRYERPTVMGPTDALAVSLNERGRIDVPFIADTLGVTENEAIELLGDQVFEDPAGGNQVPVAEYLSGDVVTKLEEAKAAMAADDKFARNVAALEDVQPAPLTRVDIRVLMGAPWIDGKYYKEFAEQVLGLQRVEVVWLPASKVWQLSYGYAPRAVDAEWGHPDKKVDAILTAAMNNKSLIVTRTVGEGDNKATVTDQKATEEVQSRIDAIRDAFSGNIETGVDGWVWQDEARARELEGAYNAMFNRLVPMQFDGTHLTFPGINKAGDIRLPKYRTSAIWRIITKGNTLLAHGVGSGKTFTSIMSGMEQKRLGLIQRPAYVVPNHMLEQFSREFLIAYPNAKLLVADKDLMSKARRKELAARAAAERWDGVIITHDAFGRISMSDEYVRLHMKSEIDAAVEMLYQAKAEEDARSPTVKDIQKKIKTMRERMDKLAAKDRKDDGITFEEMGIDFLYVDEAHLFKNLAFNTRQTRLKGLSSRPSQRATDLFMKIQYLEQSRPGRSAVFMTGTPVSNTMAELYTMQRYLQKPLLEELGLDVFDAWLSTFGEVKSEPEIAPNGRDIRDTRALNRFVNIPELMNVYSQVADVQTPAMLNLKVPKLKTGAPIIIESELSDVEEVMMQDIVRRSEEVKGKKPEKGADNILKVMSDGLKLATDIRLINPDQPINPDGKLSKAADNITRIYEEGTGPALAQIVFLDMGVPGSEARSKPGSDEDTDTEGDVETFMAGNFNLYEDLRAQLMERGIPREQIAFVHDANNDIKKARLFKAVRDGQVRILIGSTGKMGVGTNVQKHLVAMHHIDAPWRPADLEQRDGRIIRQGNLNEEISIYRYITRRSLDAVRWQQLERKAKFIAQLQAGARGVREAEDIDSPLPEAAQVKAAATGNPMIMEHAELQKEVSELEAIKRGRERQVVAARQTYADMEARAKRLSDAVERMADDVARVQDLSGENFVVTLDTSRDGMQDFNERKAAGEEVKRFILAYAERAPFGRASELDLGMISNFRMLARVSRRYDGKTGEYYTEVSPSIEGSDTYFPGGYFMHASYIINADSNPVSLIQRWESAIKAIPGKQEALNAERVQIEAELPALGEKTQTRTFDRQADLDEKKARVSEIEMALNPDKRAAAEPVIPEDRVAALVEGLASAVRDRTPYDSIPALIEALGISTRAEADAAIKAFTESPGSGLIEQESIVAGIRRIVMDYQRYAEQERQLEPLRDGMEDGNDILAAITAYHGSPHDFDRFDLNMIGTGEGAQAFGHGLYFAESPGVARAYRESLSEAPKWKKEMQHDQARLRMLEDEAPRDWLGRKTDTPEIVALRGKIERLQAKAEDPDRQGRLYTVNIKAKPEEFLDWDKPLSAQPEKVRSALGEFAGYFETSRTIADGMRKLAMDYGGADMASARLEQLGIPGIRYLDGGSRADGAGTYNYVIFDDSLIEIKAKDGKPVTGLAKEELLAAMSGPRGFTRAQVYGRLSAGTNHVVSSPIREAVKAQVAALQDRLPRAVAAMPVYTLVKAANRADGKLDLSFRDVRGDRVEVVTFDSLDKFDQTRAFHLGGKVFLIGTTLDPGDVGSVGGPAHARELAGQLWHESVHGLFHAFVKNPVQFGVGEPGKAPRDRFNRIIRHALSSRILDMDLRKYLMLIGNADADKVQAGAQTIGEAYEALYANRTNKDFLIMQEAVAHLLELRVHGYVSEESISPIRADIDALFGESDAADAYIGEAAVNYQPTLDDVPTARAILQGYDVSADGDGSRLIQIGPDAVGYVTTAVNADGMRARSYKTMDGQFATALESRTGTWSIQHIDARNVSEAGTLMDAVEYDLGQRLTPDGWLTPDRLEDWAETAPEWVQNHISGGGVAAGLYAPPSHLGQIERVLRQAMTRATDSTQVSKIRKKLREIKELRAGIGVDAMQAALGAGTTPPLGQGYAPQQDMPTDRPEKSLSDLMGDLARIIESPERRAQGVPVAVRQGRLSPALKRRARAAGGDVAGQYDRRTGVERLAIPKDFVTMIHESGHALETMTHTRDALAQIKTDHADDLIMPPAPNIQPQPFPAVGFSGIDLDAESLAILADHVVADRAVRSMAAAAGQARATGGRFNRRAYEQAQEDAGRTRATLIRRYGRSVTDTMVADIKAQNLADADIDPYLATRFTATGVPQPRPQLQATDDEISERFADWFQDFISNPKAAEAYSPDLYNAFIEAIDGLDPAMLRTFEQIQEGYQALVKASPIQALRSRMETNGRKGLRAELARKMEERGGGWTGFRAVIRDWSYGIYKNWINDKHPLTVATRLLVDAIEERSGVPIGNRERIALKAIHDPQKRARLAEHARVHATSILQDGVRFNGDSSATGRSFAGALTAAFGGDSRAMWSQENVELFGTYLSARRLLAEWRRKDRGEIDFDPDKLIERTDLEQIVAELDQKHPNFARGAQQLYDFQRDMLQHKFDNGFLDQKLFDELVQREDYVPLQRKMDDKGVVQALSKASGRNKAKMIQRFLGSTRDIINPLESIMDDVYRSQARIELNGVIRSLDVLARAAGPAGGVIAERIPAYDSRVTRVDLRETLKAAAKAQGLTDNQYDDLIDHIDQMFDEDAAAQIFRLTETNERGDNILYLWEGGKRVPILVGKETSIGRDIFSLFEALGQDNTNFFLHLAVGATQALRVGVTKDPSYIAVNFLRDQLQTWVLSKTYTPFVTGMRGMWQTSPAAAIAGGVGMATGTALAVTTGSVAAAALPVVGAVGVSYYGLKRMMGSNVAELSEAAKRYNAFAGMMGGIDTNLMNETGQERDVRSLRNRGYFAVPGKWGVTQAWNSMLRAMEVTEAATRVGHFDAAYRRALGDGFTAEEAAYEAAYAAHDVMDFSRHGAKMQTAARLVAFLNAALQGTDASFRTLTGKREMLSRKRTAREQAQAVQIIRETATPFLRAVDGQPLSVAEKEQIGVSAAAWMKVVTLMAVSGALWALNYDDDEIADQNDYMKSTHWMFRLGGVIWRMPKPFELAFPATAFEAALDYAVRGDQRLPDRILAGLQHTVIPPHEIQAMRLFYETQFGIDGFTGRPVVGMDTQGLPAAYQYNAYTSEFAKMVGQTLGFSPQRTDHFIRSFGATMGRNFLVGMDTALPWLNEQTGGMIPGVRVTPGAEKAWEDQMILSRFTRPGSRGTLTGTGFYDVMGSAPSGFGEVLWEKIGLQQKSFAAIGQAYRGLHEQGRSDPRKTREAKDFLGGLTDEQKAFATLATREFSSKHRDLHPLHRAQQISRIASGLTKEMLGDGITLASTKNKKSRDPEKIELTPKQMGKVKDILSDIKWREQNNALQLTGIRGWAHKKILPVEGLLGELKAVSPHVYDEYMARQRKGANKVFSFRAVQQLWPEARKRLLKDGLDAELGTLTAEARAID